MRVKTLLLYMTAKAKEETRREIANQYTATMLWAIARALTRSNDIPTLPQMIEKIEKGEPKDNRNADQIVEDLKSKLKKRIEVKRKNGLIHPGGTADAECR